MLLKLIAGIPNMADFSNIIAAVNIFCNEKRNRHAKWSMWHIYKTT